MGYGTGMTVRIFPPRPHPGPLYPPWMDFGACAETDPELFFPEVGGAIVTAKRVCAGCDVQAECLAYALENDEQHGVWGGLSTNERRRLRRQAA